jgi:predicted transport protein
LMIVDVSLTRGHDNPQLVFESLNSTGKELSQADLIRNYVLMSLEPRLQTRLYESYWRPMEIEFGQEAYNTHFDGFMRHYLTVRTGEIPRQDRVYEAFKTFSKTTEAGDVESMLSDLRKSSEFYCAMALGKEEDRELGEAFQDIRELRVDTAYPVLLGLYSDFNDGVLSHDDFLYIARLIESYVFRRSVCSIPTNSLNNTFANFPKELNKERYREAVEAKLMLLPSYRRFPNDEEFRRELQSRDLYNFRSRFYWLRRLENFDRKERVHVDEYTIEHIMPQNEDLRPEWKLALGEEWEKVQQRQLHTLGNLTLTGYNSEYSDRPFIEKRDMKGGFKESPVRLNSGLGQLDLWNESTIRARASELSQTALKVWPSPHLGAGVLDEYRKPKSRVGYTIDDHPHIALGSMKPVFEELRKEILALDRVVTEEFLKQYVAYKAETNFVDIEPQAGRLWLFINVPFAELSDPQGRAEDVANRGKHGNGDVRLPVRSVDDIPYAIGLIRQALDRQIEDGVS